MHPRGRRRIRFKPLQSLLICSVSCQLNKEVKKGVGFASRNSFPNCWCDYYSDSIIRSIINSLGMGGTFCIYWRNVPNHWISHPLTTIVERKSKYEALWESVTEL